MKIVLFEVSMIKFILRISNEIKVKVKVVLLEVSLMDLIFRISNKMKFKVKVMLLEVSLMDIQGDQRRTNGRRKWCY